VETLNLVEPLGDPHRRALTPQLAAQLTRQPHRLGLHFLGVPTRPRLPCNLFFRHNSIQLLKDWSLQRTRGGSVITN
jgi:hypothetical protein